MIDAKEAKRQAQQVQQQDADKKLKEMLVWCTTRIERAAKKGLFHVRISHPWLEGEGNQTLNRLVQENLQLNEYQTKEYNGWGGIEINW